jgi:ATP-dependent DNA helicase PIF1
MNSLTTKEYFYDATINGKFDKSSYPTEPRLYLKRGAQIMMLKNDSQKRWVNGTLGIVKNLTEYDVEVEIDGTTYSIEKATWEVIEYQYNKEENKIESIVTGSFTQYALKLAWAITIHKSQGQTFENVVIDLGTGAFAHGQTYVALSRCTSLEGIILKTQIRQRDIILDPKVIRFIRERTQYFLN